MTDSKQLPALQFDSKGCAFPETVAERLVLEQVKTGEYALISSISDVENSKAWTLQGITGVLDLQFAKLTTRSSLLDHSSKPHRTSCIANGCSLTEQAASCPA